jgi:broad specificity phosphatase PhoE
MSAEAKQIPVPTATQLTLLRHAEVDTRYHGIFGGQIDMDLSPRGHDQAAALAKYLQKREFDAIYASPMKRAQQTLQPLIASRNCPSVTLPGLREVHFGDWTGLSFADVKARFAISAYQWLDQLEQAVIPNAETVPAFRGRVEPHLRQMLQDHPGRKVAIVCHGGTIRMLLSILLGLPLSRMALFEIEYASVTDVHLHPHKTEIQLLNFTPWRDLV